MSFQNLSPIRTSELTLNTKQNSLFSSEMLSYDAEVLEKIVRALLKVCRVIVFKVSENGTAPTNFARGYSHLCKRIFDQVENFHSISKKTKLACLELLSAFFNIKSIFSDREVYIFKSSYLNFCSELKLHKNQFFVDSLRTKEPCIDDSSLKLGKRSSYTLKEENLAIERNASVITFAHLQSVVSEDNNFSFKNYSPHLNKSMQVTPFYMKGANPKQESIGALSDADSKSDIVAGVRASKEKRVRRGDFSEPTKRNDTSNKNSDDEANELIKDFSFDDNSDAGKPFEFEEANR